MEIHFATSGIDLECGIDGTNDLSIAYAEAPMNEQTPQSVGAVAADQIEFGYM
ncbi:MAG: hypothetical protein M3O26_16320 [Pseudomonadota bacterium]|nr:hypothetical protein [Pseudomonadota bacterium]